MFILKLAIPGSKTLVHYNTQKSHGVNKSYARIILNTVLFLVTFLLEALLHLGNGKKCITEHINIMVFQFSSFGTDWCV